MIIHCNPGPAHWSTGMFRPHGPMTHLPRRRPRSNPTIWDSGTTYAARMFVGFNRAHGGRANKLDDLIRVVRKVRTDQVGDPGASFIVQKGLYKHADSNRVVEENGAQVILINTFGTSPRKWTMQMQELAEQIAESLDQESVVLEIQRNGITKHTYGVGP